MASSGAMADFGRMPTERKVLVFVVIGMMLGLLYWRFVFKDLKERVEITEAEHQSLVTLNSQLEADIPKYAVLRQQMEELDKRIKENQKALPTEAEVPHFFETLERKMHESGVEITKWTKRNEEPVESFVKVPVDIELVGTFMQLKRFFASLVQQAEPAVDEKGVVERERIVSIENLRLTQPVVRNREIVLSARFTAVTFRQDDNEAKAQPAAPTKAGAPPTPMPPANTPAGAKVRTENAIDKAEKRTEQGTDKLKEGM